MSRRMVALLLAIGILVGPQSAPAWQTAPDPEGLTIGIRQVHEGDFDAALITLDGVVKRLGAQKGEARQLARAYTYLAIAYVGLAQQETAKAKLIEAWKADESWTPSPKEFPPNVIEFFEQVTNRRAAEGAGRPARPAASPTLPTTTDAKPQKEPQGAQAKKGGSRLPLLLAGAGAVAAAAAVAAGAGAPSPGITLVASNPGVGGTVTLEYNCFGDICLRNTPPVVLTFSLVTANPRTLERFDVFLYQGSAECFYWYGGMNGSVRGAAPTTVSITYGNFYWNPATCPAPFTTQTLDVKFGFTDGSELRQTLPVGWTFRE